MTRDVTFGKFCPDTGARQAKTDDDVSLCQLKKDYPLLFKKREIKQ